MKNVSDYLKRERELRGISLEDIAKDTCIPLKIIESLEKGDENSLPQDIFIKGYIKNFCKSLGLDDTEALLQFDIYLKEKKDNSKTSTFEENNKDDFLTKEPSSFNKRNTVFLLFLVSLVILVVYSIKPDVTLKGDGKDEVVKEEIAFKESEETTEKSEAVQKEDEKSFEIERKENKEIEINKEEKTPPKLQSEIQKKVNIADDEKTVKTNDLHVLNIKASDLTWIKIVLDGETEKEVMLREGEVAVFSAYKEFLVELGNAGGVIITLDGVEVEPVGEIGQVRHIRYNFEEKENKALKNVAHEEYKVQ